MKARGAAVQGALAVAGLAAAYFAWQKEPEPSATDVTVLDVSKNAITSVGYEDPKQHIELTRTQEDGEPVVWFTVTAKELPPVGHPDAGSAGTPDGGALGLDAGAADAGAPTPFVAAAPKKPRQFRGNDLADKLWEKFGPFRASRSLGALDEAKLKEIGLDKPDRFITVAASGAKYDYQVGTIAQGVVNPYFRDSKDGKVYLVKGTILSDFEFASSRLVDRRLHTFKIEDFDEERVKAGDATRDWVTLGEGKLAPKSAPTTPDAFAKNWSDRVFRLIVTEVLGKDETPPQGAPQVELRVEYLSRGRTLGWFELGHSGGDVYCRTEHTAGWMKLPGNSADIIAEAKKVTAGS
jgi:hypothetical protein